MVAVTTADELVTVLPFASSMVAVTVPRLPPEATVEGMELVAIWVAGPAVTVTEAVLPVSPGLLVVTVYVPGVVRLSELRFKFATPLTAVAVTVCE